MSRSVSLTQAFGLRISKGLKREIWRPVSVDETSSPPGVTLLELACPAVQRRVTIYITSKGFLVVVVCEVGPGYVLALHVPQEGVCSSATM